MKKLLLIVSLFLMMTGVIQAQTPFTAVAFNETSYAKADSAAPGNHRTWPCQSTGRVQFKIQGGSFPYSITPIKYGTPDDTLGTVVFATHQYSGDDTARYDYLDYYTVDSLPVGTYDFIVTDGGGNTIMITYVSISEASIYPYQFYVAARSTKLKDYNIIGVMTDVPVPYYYMDELLENAQYRIIYGDNGGIYTSRW